MKATRHKGTVERTILTAMVVSDEVLEQVTRSLQGRKEPFRSRWMNLVARWCMTYFGKYRKAPRRAIQSIFHEWAAKHEEDESVELVGKLLSSLSNMAAQARELNAPYVVDLAAKHFRHVQLVRVASRINDALEDGDMEEAEEAAKEQPIAFGQGEWVNLGDHKRNAEAIRNADQDVLLQFRGDLGEFFKGQFCRDAFISLAGPEKRGKSYWLQDIAYEAIRQRRRTLYYVVGDMSENQVRRRFIHRVVGHPGWATTLELPSRMRQNEGVVQVRTELKDYPAFTPKLYKKGFETMQRRTASQDLRLKLKVMESGNLSATDIATDISNLARSDWVPDVVVVDYADVLAPEPETSHFEFRHQINATWMELRAISQRYHCCLVTATQTAATSYDSKLIRKRDFSEDKRKAAHVTGMVGLNQTPEEKKQGLYRLNWVYLREGHWADTEVVTCAGNLSLARPCIISKLF